MNIWGFQLPTLAACVVGHEIVGTAIRVGTNVKHIQLGDRVGVGAQGRSCLRSSCPDCTTDRESYCFVDRANTYASELPNNEGITYGGYAKYNRSHSHFVIPIPEGLDSANAAPMLCAGITMYSPLRRNGCGPGTSVGILGVGGLGHFGVLFCKALGADRIVGISRNADKRDDVLKLGADDYIATETDVGWQEKHKASLDLIISTISSDSINLSEYLWLLKTQGTFVQVGYVFQTISRSTLLTWHRAPDGGKLPPFSVFDLLARGFNIGGSGCGSPAEIREMLQLAVEKKVEPWIQKWPFDQANEAILSMNSGEARYRYVLERVGAST